MTTPAHVAQTHAAVFPDCPLSVLTAKLAEEVGEVAKEAVLAWEDTLRPRLGLSDGAALREVEDVLTVCMVLVARLGGDWGGSVDAACERFVERFG